MFWYHIITWMSSGEMGWWNDPGGVSNSGTFLSASNIKKCFRPLEPVTCTEMSLAFVFTSNQRGGVLLTYSVTPEALNSFARAKLSSCGRKAYLLAGETLYPEVIALKQEFHWSIINGTFFAILYIIFLSCYVLLSLTGQFLFHVQLIVPVIHRVLTPFVVVTELITSHRVMLDAK